MVDRIRARLRRIEAANLNYVAFAAAFFGGFALLAALWQMVLSAQMHFAPSCSPDDTVRLSCTYTAKVTIYSMGSDTITIHGGDFLTNEVDLPLGSDVSFIHVGDVVTVVEWHGHIASLTEKGQTFSAQGSPDAGPVSWPGVLVFSAVAGAVAFTIWKLAKRTRVTLARNFWG